MTFYLLFRFPFSVTCLKLYLLAFYKHARIKLSVLNHLLFYSRRLWCRFYFFGIVIVLLRKQKTFLLLIGSRQFNNNKIKFQRNIARYLWLLLVKEYLLDPYFQIYKKKSIGYAQNLKQVCWKNHNLTYSLFVILWK